MKKLLLFLLVLAGGVSTASADSMYILGGIPFGDWKTNAGVSMTDNGNGIFSYTFTPENTQDYYLMFTTTLSDTDNDWTLINTNGYRPSTGNSEYISLDNWFTNVSEKGDDKANTDRSFHPYLEAGIKYTIVFDEPNRRIKVYKNYDISNVYILGTLNNGSWAPNSGISTEKAGHTFTSDYVLASGEDSGYSYFSFSTQLGDNWSAINTGSIRFGAVSDGSFLVMDNYLGTPLSLTFATEPNAFKIPAGTYKLSINTLTMELTISKFEKVTTNASGFCTYVNSNPLTISDATAYYAVDQSNGSAKAYTITNPVANTPMLIKGDPIKTYYFAVAKSGKDLDYTNAFKAGTGAAVSPGVGPYNYILKGNEFYRADGTTNIVATNKAYLQLSQAATARVLLFDDEEEVTGITSVKSENSNVYFDLQGRRVAQPTKGLYIMNGKKFIKK